MTSLFKPPKPAATAATAEPPTPRTVRQPRETDPSIIAAGRRTRRAALRRRGRLSTILTDTTRETVGSSGQRLGA